MSAPIMSSMPNASPIRRYILLRHRAPGTPAPRWSLERIGAPAPRNAERAPARSPRSGAARPTGA